MSPKRYITTIGLAQALRDEGFDLPENVMNVRLLMRAGKPMSLRYDLFVDDENLGKLARALERLSRGGGTLDRVRSDG